MRCFLLLALVALTAAATSPQPKQRAADQELLKKQQDTIQLLQQIHQEIPNEQLQILGQSYDIVGNAQNYQDPIIVQYYGGAVENGLVQPKGTVYTNSIPQLRKEVSLLYTILLGAQDYQTFLSTAAWARVHVNEGQFVKAYTAAILQRPDTQGIILPAQYEITPHNYFDARIIQEAQDISAKGIETPNVQNVVIPVNYSAYLPHGEHQLNYFTQDVGLASYYGYINLAGYILHKGHGQGQGQQQQPIGGVYQQGVVQQQPQIGHGARYYYLHQQLLAHYQLNRLSNGLGPIQQIDYTQVQAPYQPHLRHPNGLEFPGRPEILTLSPQQNNLVHYVQTLEQRLKEAIDTGHVITPQGQFLSLYQPQGLNILGELIEGTGKSVNPRYYGSLQGAARQLLGNAPQHQNIWEYTPSVLELGQTAVRDPAFYQLYQKVIQLFQQYQQSLPAYQSSDLVLPGVSIQSVDVSQLTTFFDDYYVNLDSATVQQTPGQHHQHGHPHIQAHLKRLDHQPYQYQINVQSEKPIQGAVVRVYLGPKYNYQGQPISISQHRHLFVELDQFIQDLQQGQNVIVRHSQQAPGQSHDYPSVQQIQQSVDAAIRSQQPLYITQPQQIFGFPARLSLPKGTPSGLPLQLLVVISGPGQQQNVNYGPVIPEEQQTYQQQHYQVVSGEQYQQQVQGQVQQSQVSGIQQTVEVLPPYYSQQGIQAVKAHNAQLYSQHHGQYPYTQLHGQGVQVQGQYGQGPYGSGPYGQQGQQYGQQGQQYGQQGQQYHGQQHGYQGQQGQQYHGQQGQQYHGQQQQQHQQQQQQYQQGQQQGVQGGVQGGVHGVQGVVGGVPQGLQGQIQGGVLGGVQPGLQGQIQGGVLSGVQPGLQGIQVGPGVTVGVQGGQGVQGVQGVQGGVQGGVQTGVQGGVQGAASAGQSHAGGYQGIYQGPQTVQDVSAQEYYQSKHISEIIGGAISLDGKPLGYPLDRPLAPGALVVPNIYVQDVQVYHQGQPTNEIYQQ